MQTKLAKTGSALAERTAGGQPAPRTNLAYHHPVGAALVTLALSVAVQLLGCSAVAQAAKQTGLVRVEGGAKVGSEAQGGGGSGSPANCTYHYREVVEKGRTFDEGLWDRLNRNYSLEMSRFDSQAQEAWEHFQEAESRCGLLKVSHPEVAQLYGEAKKVIARLKVLAQMLNEAEALRDRARALKEDVLFHHTLSPNEAKGPVAELEERIERAEQGGNRFVAIMKAKGEYHPLVELEEALAAERAREERKALQNKIRAKAVAGRVEGIPKDADPWDLDQVRRAFQVATPADVVVIEPANPNQPDLAVSTRARRSLDATRTTTPAFWAKAAGAVMRHGVVVTWGNEVDEVPAAYPLQADGDWAPAGTLAVVWQWIEPSQPTDEPTVVVVSADGLPYVARASELRPPTPSHMPAKPLEHVLVPMETLIARARAGQIPKRLGRVLDHSRKEAKKCSLAVYKTFDRQYARLDRLHLLPEERRRRRDEITMNARGKAKTVCAKKLAKVGKAYFAALEAYDAARAKLYQENLALWESRRGQRTASLGR